MWDAVSAGWARWWEVFEHAAQPVSNRLVDLAGIAPGHVVLDLATGLGEPAVTAARRAGPHGRVVATDNAPAMLRGAAARVRAMDLSNIEFRRMDAETPDMSGVLFDAILCRWGLMFVSDLDASLRRILALLKPGGRFATAAWGDPADVPLIRLSGTVFTERVPLPAESISPLNAFRLSERGLLERAMKEAGFSDITREELPATFEFDSAEAYTRFRRDVTDLDAARVNLYSPDVVEAAWQAVTAAARAHEIEGGRVRFTNTAVCFSGKR